MIIQEKLIQRVRARCEEEEQLVAALMYGSFTKGEGDAFSDIEFYLFFEDLSLPAIDRRLWLEQIAPIDLLFVNEFGVTTAVLHNLVRAEFHFEPASQISQVCSWGDLTGWPEAASMLVLDRSGELTKCLQAISGTGPDRSGEGQQVWFQFLNWMLFGRNVLDRGEAARALELLHIVHRHLLWLARLVAGVADHWQTPSRGLEEDLPAHMYARFKQCTSALEPASLRAAYDESWIWGLELATALAAVQELDLAVDVVSKMMERFSETSGLADGRGSMAALREYGLEKIDAVRFQRDHHSFTPSACVNCGVAPFSLAVTHHEGSTGGDFKGLIAGICQVCGTQKKLAGSTLTKPSIREAHTVHCSCGGRSFLVGQVSRFEGDDGLPGFFDEAVIVAQCIRCQRHQLLATID